MNRHEQRIGQLQSQLLTQGMGAALLFYSRDIFYYTGIAQPAFLAVFPDDYHLFIRSGHAFALQNTPIDPGKISPQRDLQAIYNEYFSYLWNKRLATEMDLLPANSFLHYQSIFQGFEFHDITPTILQQRAVKDAHEVAQIRQACQIVAEGQQAVYEHLLPGMTELELAAAIEHAHRLAGHEGDIFLRRPDLPLGMGPMGSGPNLAQMTGLVYSITGVGLSPSLPIGPSNRVINAGDPVVIDIPALHNGYHADQSRTYVAGQASRQVRGMYQDLKEIADYTIAKLRPGLGCDEAYQLAMNKAREMKVEARFLRFGQGQPCRLIGHSIGLEVNEPPVVIANNRAEIPNNCVLALEMHMLDPQFGVVKLEDTLHITQDGTEILTTASRALYESSAALRARPARSVRCGQHLA